MADGRVVIDVMLEDGSVAKGVADLDKQLGGLGKSGEQASLGLGKIVTALGLVALGAKAIGMVKNSISSAFGRIDTMESFERVMTVITGSTEETNRALQRTGDIVTGTGYGLDVAAKAVQNFVTRGIDVDKATDRIEAWGDAVAFYGDGSNEQFANVTDALAKMSTTGRVHMDQLNRLFDVGIDAVGMYAKATGRDAESVQKDLSAGRITAEEFIDTVTEAMMEGTNGVVKIAGAAKEAGASWGASFDNMQAAVTRGVVNIIQKIDEMLTSNGLPTMRDMIAENGRLFERVLNSIADNIPAVVERIKSIYNALEPWLPLIKAVAAGVGAAILAFAGLNSAKNIVENLTQSFAVLNKVLKMNPWVLVVAAAVAAVVLIYQNWEPISGFFINLWNSIKEITLTVWESIKGVWQATAQWFTDLWAATVEFFTSIWSGIVDFFSSLWQSIVKIATSVWDVVVERWNEVVTHVKTIFSPLIDFYVTMWETISNNAKQYWNNIKSMFDTVWNNIRIAAKAAWELIKNVILGPILLLINLATGDMESFRENLRAIWGNIKNAASTIWNALKDSVVTVVKTLISNVRLAWDTFKVYISGLWTALLRTATNIFENIRASVREKTNQAKSTLQSIWNSVKSFFTETLTRMWNTVQQKFQDIVNAVKQKMNEAKRNVIEGWNAAMEFLRGIDLVQIGKDIIQGLINGIKGKIEDVRQAITDVTDAITGRIKSILQIASPSKLMKQFGNWVGEGLAIGMNDTVTTVKKSSDKLAAAAVPDLRQEIKATESQLRELNRVITDENNKTSRDRLNAVQNFIDNKKRLELISTQDEIAYWQEAVRQFKSGTEERRVAALALRDAKRNIDQQMFNSEKAWIEEKKKLNELSLFEEMQAWEQVAQRYAEGSQKRIEAEQNVANVKRQIHEELKSISDDYLAKVQQVNEQLIAEEKRLNDEYQKAVDDRTKALRSFAGIFDEIKEKETIASEHLINNLEAQVNALAEWSDNIQTLAERGIDEGLLAELQSMGPKASAEIMALVGMSDEQLNRFESLWREKSHIAREHAVMEMEGLREDTENKIQQLHEKSSNQLEELKIDFIAKTKELREGSEGEFNVMSATLPEIGKDAINGLIDGLDSMKGALAAKARELANIVQSTMTSVLDIHSPSRWMRDKIGKMIPAGIEIGIDAEKGSALKKAEEMASWFVPNLASVLPKFPNSQPISTVSNNNSRSFEQRNVINVKSDVSERQLERMLDRQSRRLAMEWG